MPYDTSCACACRCKGGVAAAPWSVKGSGAVHHGAPLSVEGIGAPWCTGAAV